MAKKWTKKDLEAAAEDFNKFIDPNSPIPTGEDTTVTQLEKDIKDVVENFLEEGDEISEETVKLLVLMGLKKEPEEPVEKTGDDLKKATETKEEPPDKKEIKKKGKTKDKVKKTKYTRAQAFCDALKGKGKTITEIAEKAKELHGSANPGKKQPQLMSIEWAVRDYIQPLVILGFVIEKDKKYSLK